MASSIGSSNAPGVDLDAVIQVCLVDIEALLFTDVRNRACLHASAAGNAAVAATHFSRNAGHYYSIPTVGRLG